MFVHDGLIEASLLFLMAWCGGGVYLFLRGVDGNQDESMARFQVEASERDRKRFTLDASPLTLHLMFHWIPRNRVTAGQGFEGRFKSPCA